MLARTIMVRGLPSIEHPNQFVKDVSLASNQGRAFQKKLVQEQPSHCNLFILMCVDLSSHHHLVNLTTFFSLLMIWVKKTWVYFLKQKSEAFGAFKKFKAFVEK